jgi:hypothetical protein
MRSVFSTGTFKSAAYGSFLAAIALATPFVASVAQRYVTDQKTKDTISDVAGLVMALTGSTGLTTTLLGVATNRASVKDQAYTPNWMAGFNKADLIVEDEKAELEQRTAANQVASLSRRATVAEAGQAEATKAIAEVLSRLALPPVEIAGALIKQLTPDDLI